MGPIDSHANFHVMRYQPREAGVADAAVNARSVCGDTFTDRSGHALHRTRANVADRKHPVRT
jgi:hypothetical protein